ncbi:MAG: twin-arginine translocase TatA/TatE family subunit [Phycisphaerae bacterium]|nr:twin-arginine translocase TatA/TatE family subunit [Phycisphaerae bacterium]
MLAFISGISTPGLLIILVVALLLFGNRLPEVARSLGRAMNEFKRGLKDVNDDVTSMPDDTRDHAQLHAPKSNDEMGERSKTADEEKIER